jgi:hypothetical protein
MSPLFGPSADKILESGTPVDGVVTGIEVKSTHDEDAVRYFEWAVDAGGTTYGIRQELAPTSDVRLGMPVRLRVDGKNAVIEWGDNSLHRWKMVSPPAPGIIDDHDDNGNRGALSKAQKAGRAVTLTILELVNRSVAMGLGATVDARVRVEPAEGAAYESTVPNVIRVPGYAAHLPVVGTSLPGWETKGFFGGDGVIVDWPAAAMATPGLKSASAVPQATGGLFGGVGGAIATMQADTEAASSTTPPAEGDMPEIPEYAKKLMKKFGVDPESLK